MRAGVIVSIIGHAGAILMTTLIWNTSVATTPSLGGAAVPVEIVDVDLESNVRALTQDAAEEEAAAAEEEQIAATEPTPAPTPTPRRRSEDDAFEDLLRNPGMVNHDNEERRRRRDGAVADRDQAGAGLGTAERVSLEARATALTLSLLERCWRSTEDMPDPERLIVVVEVRLNRNGSLNGQPTLISPARGAATFNPLMAEAVRRAQQAVRQCDPFSRLAEDPIVGEHYDLWRVQQVRFGPRQE
jgi:hypothetical protein